MKGQSTLLCFYVLWYFVAPMYFVGNYGGQNILLVLLFAAPAFISLVLLNWVFPAKSTLSLVKFPFVMPLAVALLMLFLYLYNNISAEEITITRSLQLSQYSRFVLNIPILALCVLLINFYCKWSAGYKITLCIALFLSVLVAFESGRRTSAILPILLCSLLYLDRSNLNRFKKVVFLLATLSVLSVLLLFVSAIRLDQEALFPSNITESIFSRLFNTGKMALHVIAYENQHLYHSPINYAFDKLKSDWLNGDTYYGVGNVFGRWYGFLRNENLTVGINPGVLAEFYVSSKWFGSLYHAIFVSMLFFVIKLSDYAHYSLGIVAAIFFGHAMQMEIGYTTGIMVRFLILSVIIIIFKILVSSLVKNYNEQNS